MDQMAAFFRRYSLAFFLIPAGLIVLMFGFLLSQNISGPREVRETTATVSRMELTEEEHYDGDIHYDAAYDVYVKYNVDGKEYEEYYGNFSEYKEGDTLKIKYNPDNPAEIGEPITLGKALIFMISGGIAILGGIISAVFAAKKERKYKKIQRG